MHRVQIGSPQFEQEIRVGVPGWLTQVGIGVLIARQV
jgi:hypothetical protein